MHFVGNLLVHHEGKNLQQVLVFFGRVCSHPFNDRINRFNRRVAMGHRLPSYQELRGRLGHKSDLGDGVQIPAHPAHPPRLCPCPIQDENHEIFSGGNRSKIRGGIVSSKVSRTRTRVKNHALFCGILKQCIDSGMMRKIRPFIKKRIFQTLVCHPAGRDATPDFFSMDQKDKLRRGCERFDLGAIARRSCFSTVRTPLSRVSLQGKALFFCR